MNLEEKREALRKKRLAYFQNPSVAEDAQFAPTLPENDAEAQFAPAENDAEAQFAPAENDAEAQFAPAEAEEESHIPSAPELPDVSVPREEEGVWTCPFCTFKNRSEDTHCAICMMSPNSEPPGQSLPPPEDEESSSYVDQIPFARPVSPPRQREPDKPSIMSTAAKGALFGGLVGGIFGMLSGRGFQRGALAGSAVGGFSAVLDSHQPSSTRCGRPRRSSFGEARTGPYGISFHSFLERAESPSNQFDDDDDDEEEESAPPHPDELAQRIAQFPVSVVDRARDDRCVICMSDFSRGDQKMALPCFHCFHVDCILPWIQGNPTCPVCKRNVMEG